MESFLTRPTPRRTVDGFPVQPHRIGNLLLRADSSIGSPAVRPNPLTGLPPPKSQRTPNAGAEMFPHERPVGVWSTAGSGPTFSKMASRSSTSYAATTASIGTPNSTGQRRAYRAPATSDVGHLVIALSALLFAGCLNAAIECHGRSKSVSGAMHGSPENVGFSIVSTRQQRDLPGA